MDPDFYRLYEDLSVSELVRVARTPSDYVPEAVRAADRILKERGITKEEIAAEEWAIAQKEMTDGIRRNRRRDYTAWIGELIGNDMLTSPSDKWFAVLFLLYSIYYAYNIFVVIRQLAWLFRCTDCPSFSESLLAWDLGFVCYSTLCLYCILKQLWLGWSLLLIHVTFFLCMKFSTLFHLYARHDLFLERFYVLTLPALIYIAFGVVLWQPYVGATFKINRKIKSKTMLAAAFAGIVGMIIA